MLHFCYSMTSSIALLVFSSKMLSMSSDKNEDTSSLAAYRCIHQTPFFSRWHSKEISHMNLTELSDGLRMCMTGKYFAEVMRLTLCM